MAAEREKELNKKRAIAVLRRPLFFIIINFFLVNTLAAFFPSHLGDILYNLGRISILFYAGWLVIRKNLGTRWHAALAGVFIYFIDHVLLKGGMFLLNYVMKPDGLGFAAFSGVLVSFILFIPLAMFIGAMGGLAARYGEEGTPADAL